MGVFRPIPEAPLHVVAVAYFTLNGTPTKRFRGFKTVSASDKKSGAPSRAVAIETGRGWRISKEKQSHKIDVIVALAMAAHAAVLGSGEPYYDRSFSAFQPDAIDKDANGGSYAVQQLKSYILNGCR